MARCVCPHCGREIRYIPIGYTESSIGVAIVEPEYTEIISDNGRMIKGHLRHRCPETVRTSSDFSTDGRNISPKPPMTGGSIPEITKRLAEKYGINQKTRHG
jgi:hypothetical protein